MKNVVKFSPPVTPVRVAPGAEPAPITVLPVVRIERHPDAPTTGHRQRRRRSLDAIGTFPFALRVNGKVIVNGKSHVIVQIAESADGKITITTIPEGAA